MLAITSHRLLFIILILWVVICNLINYILTFENSAYVGFDSRFDLIHCYLFLLYEQLRLLWLYFFFLLSRELGHFPVRVGLLQLLGEGAAM